MTQEDKKLYQDQIVALKKQNEIADRRNRILIKQNKLLERILRQLEIGNTINIITNPDGTIDTPDKIGRSMQTTIDSNNRFEEFLKANALMQVAAKKKEEEKEEEDTDEE